MPLGDPENIWPTGRAPMTDSFYDIEERERQEFVELLQALAAGLIDPAHARRRLLQMRSHWFSDDLEINLIFRELMALVPPENQERASHLLAKWKDAGAPHPYTGGPA